MNVSEAIWFKHILALSCYVHSSFALSLLPSNSDVSCRIGYYGFVSPAVTRLHPEPVVLKVPVDGDLLEMDWTIFF
jgi:hypothetical protein